MSQKALFVHISDRRCRQSWVNKPSCESCTNGHVNDHCISNFITASEHFKSSTAQLHSFHSTYPTLQKWCAFSNAYSPQDTKDSPSMSMLPITIAYRTRNETKERQLRQRSAGGKEPYTTFPTRPTRQTKSDPTLGTWCCVVCRVWWR